MRCYRFVSLTCLSYLTWLVAAVTGAAMALLTSSWPILANLDLKLQFTATVTSQSQLLWSVITGGDVEIRSLLLLTASSALYL